MNISQKHHWSDIDLVERLKKSQKEAFDIIFNRYWELLFTSANKVLHDENASKDAVQEVLIDLWSRRENSNIQNLKAYLIQAVKNKVASQLRNGRFTERHLKKIEHLAVENSTEEKLTYNELEQTIMASIDKLPSRCREIFYLSRIQGMKNQEIAERLNLSKRTVETQISKALRSLRIQLEPTLLSLITLFLS